MVPVSIGETQKDWIDESVPDTGRVLVTPAPELFKPEDCCVCRLQISPQPIDLRQKWSHSLHSQRFLIDELDRNFGFVLRT